MATDVYKVNAILSAIESTRGDVNPNIAECLLAGTEFIRQTLEEMPDTAVRATLIAGVVEALTRDNTSALAATWGEKASPKGVL